MVLDLTFYDNKRVILLCGMILSGTHCASVWHLQSMGAYRTTDQKL